MRRFLLVTPLLAALALAACYSVDDIETRDIVAAVPWPDHEEADYVLVDRDDEEEELGRGTLIVDQNGEGQFEFQLNFSSDDGTDETSVLVDAETLKPDFVRRERLLGDKRELLEGQYKPAEEVLDIKTVIDQEERTVPLGLDEEHYYDNETSLFLWRTIAFEEDYKASYHTVLANQRSVRLVTVRVVGQQELKVPAGTFETWHLELRGEGGLRHEAWYSTSPEHVLVQYDNTEQLFKLTEYRGLP